MPLNDNEIDALLGTPREEDQFDRSSLFRAAEVNPGDVADASRISREVGMPTSVVRDNIEQARADSKVRAIELAFLDAPELGDLRRDEDFVVGVKDQPEQIGAFRQLGRNITAAAKRVVGGYGVTGATLGDELGRALSTIGDPTAPELTPMQAQLRREINTRRASHGLPPVEQQDAMGDSLRLLKEAEEENKPLAPWEDVQDARGAVSTAVRALLFAGETTLTSIPEMFATILAPVAVGVSYTGQIAADRAERRRGAGARPELGELAEAAPAAALITLLNKYGADRVLGVSETLARTATRRIAGAAAAEGVTEVAQEQVQYIAERFGIDPLDAGEMVDLIMPSLVGGVGAGGIMRAGTEAIMAAAESAVKRRAAEVDESKNMLDQLATLAEAAALREVSPKGFSEMVSRLAPGVDLYVDSETAQALNQDELPPEIVERIEEAVEASTPVRFTAAEYATFLAPHAQTINDKIRVGSATAVNAEEALNIENEFKARAEAAIEAAGDADATRAEAEQIRSQVQAQIVSSGRFRNDVAEAYSTLVRDFYTATATRAGLTPAQMWAQYPLRIQSARPEGAALEQGERIFRGVQPDRKRDPRAGGAKVQWFSSSQGTAGRYAGERGSVVTARNAMKNPLVIDAKGANWDNIQWTREQGGDNEWYSTDELVQLNKVRNRHDGIIIRNVKDDADMATGELSDTYGVFAEEGAPLDMTDDAQLQPVAALASDATDTPQGFTRFRHFGNKDVAELDASFQGTGLRGAERSRAGGPQVISLYPESRTAETKEAGTGNIEYVVDIPTSQLYDAQGDPQGLRAKAREAAAQDWDINEFSYYESLIQQAGFAGYVVNEGSMAGQARVFGRVPVVGAAARDQQRTNAIEAIKGAIAANLSAEDRAIETRFRDWLVENFDEAVRQYEALPETEGGRILNTDDARELSPDYRANRAKSAAVHEPASEFIKQLYNIKLNTAPEGPVLFTGGGTGAGKTSGLRAAGRATQDYAIIYDSNIAQVGSTKRRIDDALAAGREVEVLYTYGDPIESLRRAISRAKRMAEKKGSGRTVPASAHIHSHVGSRQAVPELAELYGQRVGFQFVINKQGEPARVVEVAGLPELDYTAVEGGVRSELERQREEGALTEAEFAGFSDFSDRGSQETVEAGGSDAEGAEGALQQEVADPTVGHYLNIGLEIDSGTGQFNSVAQVQGALEAIGVNVEQLQVHPSGTEPTAVVKVDRALTPEEANAISIALQQQAVVQVSDGEGALYGPQAAAWGDFNPDFFLTLTGQPLSSVLQQSARGQITLGNDLQVSPSTITLFEKADLSTFLHESGHFFFEVMTDLAARPNAPPEIVADAQVLFKWVGFKGSAAEWRATPLDKRRAQHEQFARGFEAYLFEGKAPSPELRTLFHRFRSWLLNIYKSMARLNVNLTDEVRGVMDRMIASRDQVAAAEQARQMLPLFKDAAAAGMDEATWAQYQNMAQDATNNAQDQLQTRSLRNMKWLANARARVLSKMQKANEAKRAAVQAEVENAIAQRPERIVETLLLTGEAWVSDADGQSKQIKLPAPHKLSTERLAALYGTTEDYRAVAADAGMVDPQALRAPWHSLPRNLVAKQGLDPEVVAEMTGFSSGDAMVQALLRMPPRAELVQRLTDEVVLRRYGDLNDPAQIERAVDIALHNQMRTRMVATELAALEGAQAVEGRRDALRRAAREFAESVVQRKRIRDLRPGQFAAGEAKAARLATEALAAGKSAEAAAHKRDQLFNGYANRAAARAQDQIETQLRYLNKFRELGTRKNLDPGYRDQIDKLLERYSLKVVSLRQIDKRTALAAWVDEQRDQGHEPAIPDELLDEARRTHYRNMTVEQFDGLVDAVKNIEHLARLKTKLLANKRQRDFEKARNELVASLTEHAPAAKPVELERDASVFARMGAWMREWVTSLRKIASVARVMDGGEDGGMAWEYFVRPLNDAADNEVKMRAEATEKLNTLFNMVPGLNPNAAQRGARALAGNPKTFIPAINKSLSLHARIAVALNAGNEGNLQRLMDGNRWSAPQVQAVIDTLSKQEMDFVQGVFDFIDSYWSQIKAKEERVTGVAPGKVDASPIRTQHGEYRGGYYPIVADPMRSDKAVQQNDAELISQSLRGAVGRATTRRGHTKERVGGQDPVRLDLGVIVQHIAQITHDLAWHETLIDYSKMIKDPEVAGLIRDHYGPEVTAMMRKLADDVARGEVAARTATERLLNHMRVGSTVTGLGLSATTTLLQFTGVTQSIVRVGAGTVARGYAQWAAKPVETTKLVYEKSEFMRQRDMVRNRELSDIFNRLDGKKHTLAKLYFWPIQEAQKMVDIPTWLGAYNKALAAGESDAKAVALADQAVTDSQASGRVHDLAEVQRGGPVLKLFTNFYSYFSATFQLAAESAARVGRERTAASVVNMATDYLLLFVVPVVLGVLIKEGLRGDLPDDPEELAAVLGQEQISYALGMFPIVREVSGALQGFSYRGPAGLSTLGSFSELVAQAAQGEADEAFWRSLNRTAGTLLHYPASQVDRTVRGTIAVAEGDAPPQAILLGPPRE